MRSVLRSVLVFEAVVVALAIPMAITVYGEPAHRAIVVGAGIAVVCVLAAGLLRYEWGIEAGTVLQAVAIACGLVVPMMFVLGAIFAFLWVLCLVLDRRIQRIQAARARDAAAAAADAAGAGAPAAGGMGSAPAPDAAAAGGPAAAAAPATAAGTGAPAGVPVDAPTGRPAH